MVARGETRQRGASLFFVLLFVAFLAGLAAAATRTGLSGARAAAAFADAARADTLGEGAAEILKSYLIEGEPTRRRGGSIEVSLPDAEIHVDYLSESARVDVNLAPLPLISGLLGAAGAEPDQVTAIVNRIAVFRAAAQAKSGGTGAAQTPVSPSPFSAAPASGSPFATASVSGAAAPPGSPPTPPAGAGGALPLAIHDVSEVQRAWLLPDDLAHKLLAHLTVSNGTATVDPVLADRLVLAALLGSDERVGDYVERRQQGFADAASALALLPVPAQAFAAFKDSEAVRAIARVSVAHRFERRYEMVLAPPAKVAGSSASVGASPASPMPVVVSWRKLL